MTHAIITKSLVALDADLGATSSDVIHALAGLVHRAGRTSSADELANAALDREAASGTGVPGHVAIPHCRCAAVTTPTLAFARLSRAVDFHGPDGDAELVFLIAAPDGGAKDHLRLLSRLARALVRSDFREQLATAANAAEVVRIIDAVLSPAEGSKTSTAASSTVAAHASSATNVPASPSTREGSPAPVMTRIVAVTACPTGIAHTYMAADALTHSAASMPDVELVVETQGSSKVDPLDPAIIAAADAVIFATDVGVKDKERFAGKPVIESGVKRAINEPEVMIAEAIAASQNPDAVRVSAERTAHDTTASTAVQDNGTSIRQAIMTGVSYMIPFVAAGGLLLALGFLFGGFDMSTVWKDIVTHHSLSNLPSTVYTAADGSTVTFDRSPLLVFLGAVMFATGQAAMGFIVAALSGYIAYALAGRPGIAPGFVGGAVSVTVGAGFIGGLVTGILAGVVAAWIGRWKVHRVVSSLMPVVVIPLLTSLIVGAIMFLVLGRSLEAVMSGLQNWLSGMSSSSAMLLGIILGLMMCFDLGGPVNKAAYLFATAGLSTGDEASMTIMAAVMATGMVPPIAMSLATFLRSSLFTPAEVENGKSAWLLGLSFISEGAIPFAAADPFRVIPSMMVGGAVTGALSMALHVTSHAPHGGVFVLFAISPWWGFLVSIAAGVVVSALCVVAAKSTARRPVAANATAA